MCVCVCIFHVWQAKEYKHQQQQQQDDDDYALYLAGSDGAHIRKSGGLRGDRADCAHDLEGKKRGEGAKPGWWRL